MSALRVLVAEDDPVVSLSLAQQVTDLGHQVLGEASSGDQALEMIRRLRPDLVVMDIKMPGMDGLAVAKQAAQENPLPVVVLTSYSEQELVERAEEAGVLAYLIKPADPKELGPAIQLARRRFQEFSALRQEVDSLKDALETRKLVERAKGILMDRQGLTEADAFRKLQKLSRDHNRKLGETAQLVVNASEIL